MTHNLNKDCFSVYLCKKSQSRIILQVTMKFQVTIISLPAKTEDKQEGISTTN